MDSETTLGVVHKAEVFACLLDGNHIHKSGRVSCVGAYFAVNLDKALHDDGFGFAGIEGILQTVKKSTAVSGHSSRSLFFTSEWVYRLRMKTMSGMQSRSL